MINTLPLLNYVKSNHDIQAINQWRTDVEKQLQESFEHGQPIREVISARANLIDEALQFLWRHAELDQTKLGLFCLFWDFCCCFHKLPRVKHTINQ